ncbi:MAG: hypothetical protein IK088_01365, partial [Lachnospiraceae bacterium]|nr:hypothetical protein [Lachnospiraceae bacterium]
AVFFGAGGFGKNVIASGSIGSELKATGVTIRDEVPVTVSKYEKIIYNVSEGQYIENDTVVCEIFRRGYQDESMVSYLNMAKQIYTYQLSLLGDSAGEILSDVNGRIRTVEDQIRASARGDGLDMLQLEVTLKALLDERTNTLRSVTPADETLERYYTELANQEAGISSWRQIVKNNAGNGIISFYFDGYELSLTAAKISTVNAAFINNVIKKNNTAIDTDLKNEVPLYRLVNPNHWMFAFVTKSNDPLRLSVGEQYYVTFPDYSTDVYLASAREPIVKDSQVVNVLEFYSDIGKLMGIRTVNAVITKSAQGMVVPLDAIIIENGVACITVVSGEEKMKIEVDVLAEDGKKAVIRERNQTNILKVGMKFVKP